MRTAPAGHIDGFQERLPRSFPTAKMRLAVAGEGEGRRMYRAQILRLAAIRTEKRDPPDVSQASHSPVGDQSSGVQQMGELGITCADISAPTPTMAGCDGLSRCTSPAIELPSGDQAGDSMRSCVRRTGAPPTAGSTHMVTGSSVE